MSIISKMQIASYLFQSDRN